MQGGKMFRGKLKEETIVFSMEANVNVRMSFFLACDAEVVAAGAKKLHGTD
jgi:hypothetical protein